MIGRPYLTTVMRSTGALVVAVALLDAVPALAQNRMWHSDGQRVVDAQGRDVRIRGANVGNWLMWETYMFGGALVGHESLLLDRLAETIGPARARAFRRSVQDSYITEEDVVLMADAGFNTIRLPINYRTLVADPECLACDGQGFRHIDRLLGWARAHGQKVILDLHAVPGAQSGLPTADTRIGRQSFWSSEADQARLVELWRAVARRYAGNETIAGYDLINEPQAPSAAALREVYRELVDAVRAVDGDHMIWLEGNALSADLSVFDASFGNNIGYSIHVYTFPFDRRRQRLADASALAGRLNAPVWIGEFGISDTPTLAETVRMMDSAPGVVGWSYWSWKFVANKPAPCALDVPQAWKAVVPWLSGGPFRGRPQPASIQQGADALVGYLESYRCTPDLGVLEALGGR